MTAWSADALPLHGVHLAPSQVWGQIRLVPVLRPEAPGDLRVRREAFDEAVTVAVGRRSTYVSYVPHALLFDWTSDGSQLAVGSTLGTEKKRGFGRLVRVLHRTHKRVSKRSYRLLPQHTSIDLLLAEHMQPPTIAWPEWRRAYLRNGLPLRTERTLSGRAIAGLEDALRVFELHPDQVGSLLFVGDDLATAMVLSHPDDYRKLHRTLLLGRFAETLYHHALLPGAVQPDGVEVLEAGDFDALEAAVAAARADWTAWHATVADSLLDRPVTGEQVAKFGRFRLVRFRTDLTPERPNHVGEAIFGAGGTVEHLHTHRLSEAAVRRARLLLALRLTDWELVAAARWHGLAVRQFVYRLEDAGFAWMLRPDVLLAAKAGKLD